MNEWIAIDMALSKFSGECKRAVNDGRQEPTTVADKGRDHWNINPNRFQSAWIFFNVEWVIGEEIINAEIKSSLIEAAETMWALERLSRNTRDCKREPTWGISIQFFIVKTFDSERNKTNISLDHRRLHNGRQNWCQTYSKASIVQWKRTLIDLSFPFFLSFLSFVADEAPHLDIACTSSMPQLSWDFVPRRCGCFVWRRSIESERFGFCK